jgi:IS30 family transposase
MEHYCRLARHERYQIEVLLRRGDGIRGIARALNRSPSTISREIRRNGDRLVAAQYWASPAHAQTLVRRRCFKPTLRRIDSGSEELLRSRVREMLESDFSPEQTAGRLRREQRNQVSYSTIYRFIYRDVLAGGDLWKRLRRPRRKRMRMQLLKNRPNQGKIMDRMFIDQRPAVINSRRRTGDYERDTIRGHRPEPAILTIVDRKSKLTRLAWLPKKTAKEAHEETVAILGRERLCCSITNDNGKEFSWHEKTSAELRVPIYFTHPYHSWERGTNENTNGLLRQYFPPKGSDFTRITAAQIQAAELRLNHRPRKCLGYQTPLEVHLRT